MCPFCLLQDESNWFRFNEKQDEETRSTFWPRYCTGACRREEKKKKRRPYHFRCRAIMYRFLGSVCARDRSNQKWRMLSTTHHRNSWHNSVSISGAHLKRFFFWSAPTQPALLCQNSWPKSVAIRKLLLRMHERARPLHNGMIKLQYPWAISDIRSMSWRNCILFADCSCHVGVSLRKQMCQKLSHCVGTAVRSTTSLSWWSFSTVAWTQSSTPSSTRSSKQLQRRSLEYGDCLLNLTMRRAVSELWPSLNLSCTRRRSTLCFAWSAFVSVSVLNLVCILRWACSAVFLFSRWIVNWLCQLYITGKTHHQNRKLLEEQKMIVLLVFIPCGAVSQDEIQFWAKRSLQTELTVFSDLRLQPN